MFIYQTIFILLESLNFTNSVFILCFFGDTFYFCVYLFVSFYFLLHFSVCEFYLFVLFLYLMVRMSGVASFLQRWKR